MGPAGAGKTDALVSFCEAGIDLFVLATESNAIGTLLDAAKRRNVSLDRIHYHLVTPTASGWDSQIALAKLTNEKSYEALASMKDGIAKPSQDAWMNVLLNCKNFIDDRTGTDYGDVTEWGDDRAFCIDTLSGLNQMARENHVGMKPSMHQGEWGVAMSTEYNLIFKLTSDRKCFFVLNAHIDRELDEVAQTTKLMVAALGRKLAPQLPKLFSEVVMSTKKGANFFWSTTNAQADLRNSILPIGENLPASFVPLVKAHQARIAALKGVSSGPTT
jgi:hypothetical protein